jgi:hypothetical protein
MYMGGPLRAEDSCQRKVHQKVPQLSGIKNIRVVEDNERRHN